MPMSQSVLTLFAALLFSSASLAQSETSAREIMHERHENFETIGEAFKTIRDELRGAGNLQAISSSAQTIHDLARELRTWFPAGTGPETGIKTEAKPEIWQNKAEFNSAAERLVKESEKFLALTTSGDTSRIAGGVRGLGGACKNCHDQFRVDED